MKRREFARVHKAWSRARVDAEVKLKVDAVSWALGERVTFLSADWQSLVSQFKQVHGVAIDETKLPSIHDSMAVSVVLRKLRRTTPRRPAEGRDPCPCCVPARKESKINKHLDQPKQLGITFDSNLTIQIRKRCMSTMPPNIEELRKNESFSTVSEGKRQRIRKPCGSSCDSRCTRPTKGKASSTNSCGRKVQSVSTCTITTLWGFAFRSRGDCGRIHACHTESRSHADCLCLNS